MLSGWELVTVIIMITLFGGMNTNSDNMDKDTVVCIASRCQVTQSSSGSGQSLKPAKEDKHKLKIEYGELGW